MNKTVDLPHLSHGTIEEHNLDLIHQDSSSTGRLLSAIIRIRADYPDPEPHAVERLRLSHKVILLS